uniref:EGF-like domain-containing protein n=1 Tax=Plectus sambesii TaxID=2011161 RepID=A0A914W7R3_9BILA
MTDGRNGWAAVVDVVAIEANKCVQPDVACGNECRTIKCPKNSDCVNSAGSYRCECARGYRMNDNKRCVDINECLEGLVKCGADVPCANSPGSFVCRCPSGYLWNDTGCADIDECQATLEQCHSSAECKNTIGSFLCICPDGKIGDDISSCQRSNKQCGDEQGRCSEFANCTSAADGSFHCQCRVGFEGDGFTCKDVNECDNGEMCQDNAECFNTIGSYSCQCSEGFMLVTDERGRPTCQGFDKCAIAHCPVNEMCSNKAGGYECICAQGFEREEATQSADKGLCVDVDECKAGTDVCADNAVCTNVLGSYECQCAKGFEGDGHNRCDDLDECAKGQYRCGEDQLCENTVGSYTCNCRQGFASNEITGLCSETDTCSDEEKKSCHPKLGECMMEGGRQFCRCKKGYAGDGITCADIDECRLGLDVCSNEAMCENTQGSYLCQCLSGFALTSKSECKDIDECAERKGAECDSNAECQNLPGTYACRCKHCYIGDGFSCERDPCCDCHEDAGSKQNADGICFDKAQFELKRSKRSDEGDIVCPNGYRANTTADRCTDKNECETGEHDCPSNSRCINLDGGYTCECSTGFNMTADGRHCQDVDECASSTACSGMNATCINTIGSFDCQCAANAALMGDHCQIIDSEKLCKVICGEHGSCRKINEQWRCLCGDGFERERLTSGPSFVSKCVDIDECAVGIDTCHSLALCNNTVGSYSCQCRAPSVGDGRNCKLGNPCELTKPCSAHAQCKPLGGVQYECECVKGFLGDGERCDPDPCLAAPNGGCPMTSSCLPDFSQQKPTASCICYEGYFGSSCEDVDECKGNHSCAINAKCVNILGSYQCVCPDGLKGDGRSECVDIDECSGASDICGRFSTCTNSIGSFGCSCLSGYVGNGFFCEPDLRCVGWILPMRLQSRFRQCQWFLRWCVPAFCIRSSMLNISDVDECNNTSLCDENARCYNFPGDFRCKCNHGYTGSGFFCFDVDECATNGSACLGDNEHCVNVPGGFECHCNRGFKKIAGICKDIDECDSSALNFCHNTTTKCVNSLGSFACECIEGYNGSPTNCAAVDPCITLTCGSNARCIRDKSNRPFCKCDPGYEGDGSNCSAMDMCAHHNCSNAEDCVPLKAGYYCECKDGFFRKGNHCQDIDECLKKQHTCDPARSTCANTLGSYHCQCKSGYQLDSRKRACTDINECASGLANCPQASDCHNFEGGYRCSCSKGMRFNAVSGSCEAYPECHPNSVTSCMAHAECIELSDLNTTACMCRSGYQKTADQLRCIDMDECAMDRTMCHPRALCLNVIGSYVCRCPPGYTGDGIDCVDVDECEADQSPCAANAACVNSAGSFRCVCSRGFYGDGYRCQSLSVDKDHQDPTAGFARKAKHDLCNPVDEHCGANAECIAAGQHSNVSIRVCVCKIGYWGNPFHECTDVNECQSDYGRCGPNAVCLNTEGTFECKCKDGFVADDQGNCGDIDECEKLDVCPLNSVCMNTYGSYECPCEPGYRTAHGQQCVDIDECTEKIDDCHSMAQCQNTPGAFKCQCRNGYEGNGKSECNTKTACADYPCDPNAACVPDGENRFRCVCNAGFRMKNGICEDIDECKSGTATCSPNAHCANTAGSYFCRCDVGYTGDGVSCQDIDECRHRGACSLNELCKNSLGSFVCKCLPGFVEINGTCADIDECDDVRQLCEMHKCINTNGGFYCQCSPGYQRDFSTGHCVDIDECLHQPCGDHGVCFNSPGSYKCMCKSGFELRNNTCSDIDECMARTNPCLHRNSKCINSLGSFYCMCSTGFYSIDRSCIDINECHEASPCSGIGAYCVNTQGSYICQCSPGFVQAGTRCREICTAESCGPQKKCRLSADMQSRECVCAVAEMTAGLINQPLCTTRRQYFDSLTQMVMDACSRNITHTVDYYGPCRATCESQSGKVICEPGLRCLLNPVTELPTCAP